MPASAAIAFGALVAGAVIMDYGVKNAKAAFAGNPGASSSAAGGSGIGSAPVAKGSFPSAVDPLPGAIGSRLDQGLDATGHVFPSPWSGKVVYSSASDPGWNGGGYVAVSSTQNPDMVYYLAEGIKPIVAVGDMVTAGQQIALPVSNPYNGIVGNVEVGRANPASPGQPLAQVVSNPAAMVDQFYNWVMSLGGPHATSTSAAGHT